MATTTLRSPDETIAWGRLFSKKLCAGDVVALCGDLGAGKTQLVKGIAVGLAATASVTSPTFTLIHEYPDGRLPLYHFDFYRLEDERELPKIGFDDYLALNGVMVIEWADKFRDALPAHTRWLHLRHTEDGAREITEE